MGRIINSSIIQSIQSSDNLSLGHYINNSITTNKLSADLLDLDSLRKIITKVLLEDPNSEIRALSESFLVQYLEDAVTDIDNNPVLAKFFSSQEQRILDLGTQLCMVRGELDSLRKVNSKQDTINRAILACVDALNYLLNSNYSSSQCSVNDSIISSLLVELNNVRNELFYN